MGSGEGTAATASGHLGLRAPLQGYNTLDGSTLIDRFKDLIAHLADVIMKLLQEELPAKV